MGANFAGVNLTRVGPAAIGSANAICRQDQFIAWVQFPTGAGGGSAGRLWSHFTAPSTETFFALLEPRTGGGFQLRVQWNHAGGTNAVAISTITTGAWPAAPEMWAVEYVYATKTLKLYKAAIGGTLTEQAYITQTAGTGEPLTADSLVLGNYPTTTYDRSPVSRFWRLLRIAGLLSDDRKTRLRLGRRFIRTEGTADVIYDYPLVEPVPNGGTFPDHSGRAENFPLTNVFIAYESEPAGLPFTHGVGLVATTRRREITNFTFTGSVVPSSVLSGTFTIGQHLVAAVGATSELLAVLSRGGGPVEAGWTVLTVDIPVDATMFGGVWEMDVEVIGVANNERHFGDGFGMLPGSDTPWSRGGIWGQPKIGIKRSVDGGATWRDVRFATAMGLAPGTLIALVDDYEIPTRIPVRYRASSTHTFADGRTIVTHGPDVIVNPAWAEWWLRDPLEPELNTAIAGASLSYDREHTAEPVKVPGRELEFTSTVGEKRSGAHPSLDVWVLDSAKKGAVEALLAANRVLLLADHLGNLWYLDITGIEGWTRLRAADPSSPDLTADAHSLSLTAVEVDAP